MNLFKRSAKLALGIVSIFMIAAPATVFLGWSVFAQAAVFGIGLILAALASRPTKTVFITTFFYLGCVFLVSLLDSQSGARVLSVWLFAGFVSVYWPAPSYKRNYACLSWFRRTSAVTSTKEQKQ